MWMIAMLLGCAPDYSGDWAGGGGCGDGSDFEARFSMDWDGEALSGSGDVTWWLSESLFSEHTAELSLTIADGEITGAELFGCFSVAAGMVERVDCGALSGAALDSEGGRLDADWSDFLGTGEDCSVGLVRFE